MKNYWSIKPDNGSFYYQFVLKQNKYDIVLIKELLNLIVLSGWEFGIIKLLDQISGDSYCYEYLKIFNSFLDKKSNVNDFEKNIRFFQQAFPYLGSDYKNPHVIVTQLAFYNENGEIEIKDVFTNEVFYPLLNPYRVHLYHHSETGSYSPLFLELSISKSRDLVLIISSGLDIWLPYYKPDYDIDNQKLEDFPINEYGYIDNRELYLLNTPRLLGFVKKIRKFFERNNGTELSDKNRIEELPVFPWYEK